MYRKEFESEAAQRAIVEHIVAPNMQLSEADEEVFEDNPLEYMRRDIEGSDTDTRRRSASDLLRGLADQFPDKIAAIGLQYVQALLATWSASKGTSFTDRDLLLEARIPQALSH